MQFRTWLDEARRRPPFTWPRKRRKRWLVASIVVLLCYPILGTLALWTGLVERLLLSEDLRVDIENPAYTIWPGRIRAKHVRILANGETQFSLEGDDLAVSLRVLPFFERRIHVKRLAAQGVRYQMRVQVDDEKGIEKRLAAYPPLKDLPGAKVLKEKKAKQTEEREADWTVEVDGLDVHVEELWFFEYRYLGHGRLRGGFMVGPQLMQVSTAVQDLGPGDLHFGEKQLIARNVRGHVTADIPKVNPEEHADTSFFELVTSRIQLKADVETLAHVGAYFAGIEVRRGSGPFAADIYLEKGLLGSKSRIDFETLTVLVKGDGFGVETDWKIDFDAAGEGKPAGEVPSQRQRDSAGLRPLLRSQSKMTYASLARGDREFTVQIHGHEEEAALDEVQLSGSTRLKRASLRMPKIVSVDLKDLDAILPEGTPLDVTAGEARASLSLDMDENYWAKGPIRAVLDGVKLNVGDVEIDTRTTFQAQAWLNPKLKSNLLDSVVLSVRGLDMRAGDEKVESWWLDLTSPRLAYWNANPPRAQGTVSIRAKSLEPLLEALAEKDVISELIPFFTRLDDFRAKATLRKAGPVTDVVLESESDVWDVSGRVHREGDEQRMAIVVGGQAVSLGVASDGDDLELMPFAKTSWLNERLRKFPKPLVEMAPAKP